MMWKVRGNLSLSWVMGFKFGSSINPSVVSSSTSLFVLRLAMMDGGVVDRCDLCVGERCVVNSLCIDACVRNVGKAMVTVLCSQWTTHPCYRINSF